MKASKLLKLIRENLKDYPIEYLKNKVTDERYKDPLTKKLAKYNSAAYDEIYQKDIVDDFEINDSVIKNIKKDIGYYFDIYGDEQDKQFYYLNGKYYCKGRVKYIKDKNSLCRYCVCKNVGFSGMFV